MTPAIELLTPQQTAALLGVTPGTLEVWRCTKRYPLRYIKIGGRFVRYRRQDIDHFINAQLVDPQAAPPRRLRRCNAKATER